MKNGHGVPEGCATSATNQQLAERCGDNPPLENAKVSLALPEPWQPIETAPKDRTPIWGCLRDDISVFESRPDLERWNSVQGPFRHQGITDNGFDIGWSVAMPVGHGGFPDTWFAGWMPLPAPPLPSQTEGGNGND